MPGHTNAALATYPELNCDGKARELYTGIEVGFSTLCTSNEITYKFIDDVIRELAAITPGPYIHIGGDDSNYPLSGCEGLSENGRVPGRKVCGGHSWNTLVYPKVPPDGKIEQGAPPADIEQLLSSMGTIREDLREVTRPLGDILKAVDPNKVEGMVDNMNKFSGQLAGTSKDAKETIQKAKDAFSRVEEIGDKVKKGEGTLGKLMPHETVYQEAKKTVETAREAVESLKQAVDTLKNLSEEIEKGEGTLGKLVKDESLYNLLEKLLAGIGLSRRQVYITNVVKCRPPGNRDPQPDEIEACRPYLDRQIELIQPRIIVTLGRFSMARYFPGQSITRIHGQVKQEDGQIIIPMFHPAAALRNEQWMEDLQQDFAKIPALLAKFGVDPVSSDPTSTDDDFEQLSLL